MSNINRWIFSFRKCYWKFLIYLDILSFHLIWVNAHATWKVIIFFLLFYKGRIIEVEIRKSLFKVVCWSIWLDLWLCKFISAHIIIYTQCIVHELRIQQVIIWSLTHLHREWWIIRSIFYLFFQWRKFSILTQVILLMTMYFILQRLNVIILWFIMIIEVIFTLAGMHNLFILQRLAILLNWLNISPIWTNYRFFIFLLVHLWECNTCFIISIIR